jgi:hypothetical protein
MCTIAATAVGATLEKAFSPTTIHGGDNSELRFTVTNPFGADARSDAGFVDTLPAGLRVANAPFVSGTCDNAAAATIASAGGSTITTSHLDVPAGTSEPGSSCTVTLMVTNVSGQFNSNCAAQAPAFTNAAGNVSVTNLTNSIAPSCLTVVDIFANGFD